MTSTDGDSVVADPMLLVAVTAHRKYVLAESDGDGVYVDDVAPLMFCQSPNVAFHCCHWYV